MELKKEKYFCSIILECLFEGPVCSLDQLDSFVIERLGLKKIPKEYLKKGILPSNKRDIEFKIFACRRCSLSRARKNLERRGLIRTDYSGRKISKIEITKFGVIEYWLPHNISSPDSFPGVTVLLLERVPEALSSEKKKSRIQEGIICFLLYLLKKKKGNPKLISQMQCGWNLDAARIKKGFYYIIKQLGAEEIFKNINNQTLASFASISSSDLYRKWTFLALFRSEIIREIFDEKMAHMFWLSFQYIPGYLEKVFFRNLEEIEIYLKQKKNMIFTLNQKEISIHDKKIFESATALYSEYLKEDHINNGYFH